MSDVTPDIERDLATVADVLDTHQTPTTWKRGHEALARICERIEALEYADAVARVWIVGLMNHESTRGYAHPVAMVRGALAGERRAIELGCDEAELRLALAHPEMEDFRAALVAHAEALRAERDKAPPEQMAVTYLEATS